MSGITDNVPIIQKAYEELQRFYANDELREKVRQRQQFEIDYHLGMNAAKQEGKAEGIVQERIDSLLRILTKRFSNVPQAIVEKLHNINDINDLRS